MSDDFDQMERLAAGLLSFKHLKPDAKKLFRRDLRKIVASRGGLSEGAFQQGDRCRSAKRACRAWDAAPGDRIEPTGAQVHGRRQDRADRDRNKQQCARHTGFHCAGAVTGPVHQTVLREEQ